MGKSSRTGTTAFHGPRHGQLSAKAFTKLFAGCGVEYQPSGYGLFMQDDPADRVYGVVDGVVEIAMFSGGGRKLVASFEAERGLVGEVDALLGGVRTVSATCVGACALMSLSRVQLVDRLQRHGDLAASMFVLLCARIRRAHAELGDRTLLGLDERLAKRLVLLTAMMGRADGWIAISQSDLAAFLGSTRESVNKSLKAWREAGKIELRRGAIRVRDLDALGAAAAESR